LDQDNVFKTKSLELIHLTKEFLKLKKRYEDSLALLIAIKKSRMLGKVGIDLLPEKLLPLVSGAKDLDDAEKMTAIKMEELKRNMAKLGSEIKNLSGELEPFFSGIHEQQQRREEIPTTASAKSN
jgi:predicted  nucleic acid-binding Zn-ribbon protein